MSKKYAGGCQCGAVRYTIKGEPEKLYACHCTECQRQSGSAFGMTMLIKESAFEVSGLVRMFTRMSDKGNTVEAYFCPECGIRIYGKPGYAKGLLSLKPGTLDDTSWLKPSAMLWMKSSQNWFDIPANIEIVEEQ